MRTRIEFYEGGDLIDVREWPLTPMEGMIVQLVNSADDSRRTVVITRVMAAGDEDAFKYMVACENFEEHEKRLRYAAEGKGRTGG